MMGLKRLVLVFCITIFVFTFSIFGASYAWYAYSNAETTLFGSTIKEAPTVIFAQTDSIISSINTPIYDFDRYDFSNINSFNVTFGDNLKDYESAISIELYDINMSPELKISNYKYELLENEKVISSGDFSNIGNDTSIVLMPNKIVSIEKYPTTYVYDLFIWLSEDGSDQNHLMNKTFGAKVRVNSAVKKK
ncbi:MAG: hypothetical protein IJO57_00935 [Bacilli bacterium]|nr:hypothetical protein [Bacilli bacterium]